MDKKYKYIWLLAKPYLKKGKMKNFVVHTKGVIQAMEMLLQKEQGDPAILIPVAILHDVGWAKVSKKLQKSKKTEEKQKALILHIKYAPLIIHEILKKLDFGRDQIEKISEIVSAHKFQDPTELDKRLLIDADKLSDVFSEQFVSDLDSYGVKPEQLYYFRKKNDFYTQTAREIFEKELKERKKEYKIE